MSYYDTIDDDVRRAKEILARGREPVLAEDEGGLTHATRGTIYGGDNYAAYKLLESFVAEIERLREVVASHEEELGDLQSKYIPAVTELGRLRAEAESDEDTMRLDREARDAAIAEARRLHAEIERLREVLHHEGIEHSECQATLITAQAEIERLRDLAESYQLLLAIMDVDDYQAAVLKWKATRDEIAVVKRLRELVDAVGEPVCVLALRHERLRAAPDCICRNHACGHRASRHQGEGGACVEPGCRCGPGGWQ